MAAAMGPDSSGGEEGFDLNLAPIIDCFVVLISFLLMSASFLAIGILDAGVAASSPSTDSTPPPPINITLRLTPGKVMQVEVSGKIKKNRSIASVAETDSEKAAVDGPIKWDFESLTQELSGLKANYKGVEAITITADDSIPYKDIIQVMESSRKTLPLVLLGGF